VRPDGREYGIAAFHKGYPLKYYSDDSDNHWVAWENAKRQREADG
jgi:hypothetical protein